MPIRLSVLTTCHSRTPFLAEMLDSFLQSGYHFRDTEILIRDNASPPGGDGDTAREYARRYPDVVRVIRNEVNCGIHRASQQGYEAARGTYVMTFGYDDIFVPFDIDAEMDFLDAHPEFCATCGIKRLFNAADGDMLQCHGADSSLFAMSLDPRETDCGMVIRAADLRAAGGCFPACVPEPPETMPDVITHIGLCMTKPFCFRSQLRGFYRRYPSQHTATHNREYQLGYQRIRAALAEHYAPLHQALLERRPMQIRPEERRPAVVLLGALLMRDGATAEEQMQYCAAAEALMPGDYGVREYRIKILMSQRNFTAALAEALAMYAEHRDQPYITQLALGMAEEAARQMGLGCVSAYRRCREVELAKHFTLTPPQRELLDRTVANFRAMTKR